MARPINANPDETRRRLLDGAILLFAAKGFHGASTRELAASAKVNVATLSYHFTHKQGLYDAAVDEVYRRLVTRTRSALTSAPAGPVDLATLVERVYVAARAERDGVRLLIRQIVDHGRLTPRTEVRHFLPSLEAIAQLAGGLIGCPPARARAGGVALGYLISRYVIQDEASLEAAFGVRGARAAHAQVVATLSETARTLLSSRAGAAHHKEPA